MSAAPATTSPKVLLKRPIPEQSPLEAGDIMCGACGTILKAKAKLGLRWVDSVVYECRNEETGCSWRLERKVYVQNGTGMIGIRPDGTETKLPPASI